MRAHDNVSGVTDTVVQTATTILGLLADNTRLRVMAELVHGEQDVTALTAAVGAARPAVSQHLGKLRLAGLVQVRRDGRRQVYALTDVHLARLVVEAVRTAEHRVSDRPAHHDRAGSMSGHRSGRGARRRGGAHLDDQAGG